MDVHEASSDRQILWISAQNNSDLVLFLSPPQLGRVCFPLEGGLDFATASFFFFT